MTLWGQLQNIMMAGAHRRFVYHNDPLGSTSEHGLDCFRADDAYTIMTLWGQLQNNLINRSFLVRSIP